MKIQYQKIENGLEILRIWQDSGIIKVPEQIEGIPVIRIAPYTLQGLRLCSSRCWMRSLPVMLLFPYSQGRTLLWWNGKGNPSSVYRTVNWKLCVLWMYESETFPWDRCNRADGERGIYRMPSGEGGD